MKMLAETKSLLDLLQAGRLLLKEKEKKGRDDSFM